VSCDSGSCALPQPSGLEPRESYKLAYLVDGTPGPSITPGPPIRPTRPKDVQAEPWWQTGLAVVAAVGAVALGIAAAAASTVAAPILAVAALSLALVAVLSMLSTDSPLVHAGRALSGLGKAAANAARGEWSAAAADLANVELVDWLWLGALIALVVSALLMWANRRKRR